MNSPGLSWAEKPGRELLRLSWPIAVSTLSYSAMTLVSIAFVARVGDAEVAGVGLGAAVYFGLLCFAIGLLRGLKTLVSQAIGAGRGDEADRYLGTGVLYALGLGAVGLVVAESLSPLLVALSADPEVGRHAATYIRVRALAAPVILTYVALRETRWGEGDTRSPMRASLGGNAVNFALDVVLVLGLGWGVVGAAVATLVGQTVELGRLAWPMRARLARLVWSTRHAKALWQQGAATGLQFTLEVGAFLLLTTIIAQMSAHDAAAHQLVLQLTHVSFLPAHALAEAVSILVGNAIGAGRPGLLRPVAHRALWLGGAYSALCTVVFVLLPGPLATMLGASSGPFHDTTVTLIRISALFLVADAANVIARGALRGAGDVVYSAVVGVVTAWLAAPPLAWLLGLQLGWGAAGGWLGLTGEIFVGAAIVWWRVERGGWSPAAEASRRRMEATASRVEDSPSGHADETLTCEAG